MRKREELTNPKSCMSRAREDEMTFVLLGRDSAAPAAIRAWVEERIRQGKNLPTDEQIREAHACAAEMERQRLLDATRQVVERIMTQHWDMKACDCWVCEAGRAVGCGAREEYLNQRFKFGYVDIRPSVASTNPQSPAAGLAETSTGTENKYANTKGAR